MARATWFSTTLVWLTIVVAATPASAQPSATRPQDTRPATQSALSTSGTTAPATAVAETRPPSATATAVATAPAPSTSTAPAEAPVRNDREPAPSTPHPDLAVRPGEVIVFLGDQLTEVSRHRNSFQFPMLVESFMTVRYPDVPLRFVNAGWTDDTAERALLRLERDVLVHEPDVVIVCLGLNDPNYDPFDQARLDGFRRDLAELVERCRQAGARVWLMTPPAVEEERGTRVRVTRDGRTSLVDLAAIRYNHTLGRYAEAIGEIARSTQVGLADWYQASTEGMARMRARAEPAAYTSDGLRPLARGHALGASTLLQAWSAEPIHVRIEAGWSKPTVSATTHTGESAESHLRITAEGARELHLPDCPLPWPMSVGEFESLSPEWLAEEMCRFNLQIADPPQRGVVICRIDAGGREIAPHALTATELKSGINLATLPLLHSMEAVRRIYNDIGTKNLYHFTVWRRLRPEPPREPELAEAHEKLIDTWLAYETGYEKLIRNRPKQINLHLRLKENVKPEQLPTTQPEQSPSHPVPLSPQNPHSPDTQTAPDP